MNDYIKRIKQSVLVFWQDFKSLPSAWLLLVQLLLLILSVLAYGNLSYRAATWVIGVLLLLVVAKVIRQTPVFTILGLSCVVGAIFFSLLILLGVRIKWVHITAHGFESAAYFCAAYGLFTVGRIRGVRCASILNNVVLYGSDSADSVSGYAGGESLTAIGEKREIEVALEAFLRLENK